MVIEDISILIFGITIFLAGCVGLIIMIRSALNKKNKRKNELKENEAHRESIKIEKTIMDIIPIQKYDLEQQFYVLEDGSVMDLFKIVTKDQNSSSPSEKNWDNMKFTKLYKMYADDIKIFALNYPCNTQQQQKYWQHKMDVTTNKALQRLQQQRLYQLEWLEKNNTSREFYLAITAKNADDFFKNKSTVINILGLGKEGLIETMEAEKKHQILFKLNNKSAYIF